MKTDSINRLIDLMHAKAEQAQANVKRLAVAAPTQNKLIGDSIKRYHEEANEYLLIAEALIEIRNAVARVVT